MVVITATSPLAGAACAPFAFVVVAAATGRFTGLLYAGVPPSREVSQPLPFGNGWFAPL
jgi:hypothetical protein